VTDLGTVRRITPGPVTRLEIETAYPVGEIALGASVCCNGCCLSVVEKGPNWMAFEVSGETLSVTTLGNWRVGTRINLERALKVGDELGGHLVSGHVDGVGKIVDQHPDGGSIRTANEIVLDESEGICILDEEGNEKVVDKVVPLFARLQNASVTEKIRMAMLGNSTARLLLVRDSNRLVSEAAVKSPRTTENDATQIAAMRSVSDEVLRLIASSRELVRGYQVKLNMVTSPRTPFTFASRLLPHLRVNDLRAIARSKNVPGAVNKAAKQMLMRRDG
jgi:hypothetical protein